MKANQLLVLLILSWCIPTILSAQDKCSTADFQVIGNSPITLPCDKLSISLTGQVNSYITNYEWTTTDGYIVSGEDSLTPMIDKEGTYYLRVEGENGCVGIDSIQVLTENNKPQINILPPPNLSCDQLSVLIDASNSTGGLQYNWTTNTGGILFGEDTPIVSVNQPGTYLLTLSGVDGCVSQQSVKVRSASSNEEIAFTIEICEGETYTINGNVYTEAGVHQETFSTNTDCDSVINFAITLLEATNTKQTIEICEGATYTINGTTYDQAGSYREYFVANNGCDSIINFDLIIIPTITDTITRIICQGSTVEFGGFIFNFPGYYPFPGVSSVTGCDSTTILELISQEVGLSINAPADITVNCTEKKSASELTITNQENIVDIQRTETIISQEVCTTVLQIDWVVIDDCGRRLTDQQILTLIDNASPTIQQLPDTTVTDCGREHFLLPPAVSDDCSNTEVSLKMNQVKTNIDACTYLVERIWTAEDACGNSTSINRTVTVKDQAPPSITFQLEGFNNYANGDTLHFACGEAPVFDRYAAIATDNCDPAPYILFIENIEYYDACSILMYCGWRAIDACDNSYEIGFYFHITDTTLPVFENAPPDITVAHLQEAPSVEPLYATDNCTQHVHIHFEETRDDTECFDRLVRSWVVSDDCGLKNTHTQYISAPTTEIATNCGNIQLRARAALQGATSQSSPLMRDDLRAQQLIPLKEPYEQHKSFQTVNSGGENTTPEILAITGSDAIVDWVFLELRDSNFKVVATRSALLQRDGDIVEVDGISPVLFQQTPGTYYITIRHRNHLGVMSAEPYALTENATAVIDFCSKDFSTYGKYAQAISDIGNTLRAGNTNGDHSLIFSGIDNDRDPIFFDIVTHPDNEETLYNFTMLGYHQCDTNMDGAVIYQGNKNDVDQSIFFNILLHPDNNNKYMNFIISEQIPEE